MPNERPHGPFYCNSICPTCDNYCIFTPNTHIRHSCSSGHEFTPAVPAPSMSTTPTISSGLLRYKDMMGIPNDPIPVEPAAAPEVTIEKLRIFLGKHNCRTIDLESRVQELVQLLGASLSGSAMPTPDYVRDFTLTEITKSSLSTGIASPFWDALEKQLAAELLKYIKLAEGDAGTQPKQKEEFFCLECGIKLTPNPMEGHDCSWMHFDGRRTCKLRGESGKYLAKTALTHPVSGDKEKQ